MEPRLVMLSGPCAGAGKSTLMRALADVLERSGELVSQVDENAVWGERRFDDGPIDYSTAWPEFRALLHERRSSAGLSADEILGVFRVLSNRIGSGSWWLQDWLWMNLVSLVVDGEAELMAWSGRFHEAAVHRRPVVLWLEVDPLIALRRAERERGGVWLARHIREFGGGVGGGSVLGALAVARGEGAADQRRVLESGGWSLVDIDASGDVASVLVEAMDGLASV